MRISREEVEHVARLARLSITEQEKEGFTVQLNKILDHMDKLRELDTTDVKPTFHVLATLKNVTRPDCIRPGLSREDALANAPKSEAGCFKVPKTVEG